MAVSIAIGGSHEDVQYNGKITWLVLLSCVIAASGGLLFGYDTGVTGGVTSMEPFLKKFFPGVYSKMENDPNTSNYCKFDSQLLTAFSSSLYMSGLIASFSASRLTRDYGRKPSIIIGGVAFLAGAAIGGVAYNIYMLICGRLLLGVGVGFANQGWRISLSTAAIPASILIVGALLLPETPNSLIQQGRDQHKAKTILQRIRGIENVQVEFDDLITASEASRTIKSPFKNILKRRYRPQLVMSIAIPFFQQVTGITVISFYAPILFRTIGFGESESLLSAVILSISGTGMTILASLIVDKLGRRVIFHIGGILMFVTQMVIAVIMAVKLKDQGALSQGVAFYL
ncbi:hypothetical protein BUALT_Bualt06G0133500 [Buddleja alternifolia]|uniref:Major facilitator superfamily (MFS) profile domain-containing protein n=1 Tax=Buddleja alternifolia TaxID=168488 RepID=A0AAV6XLQ3_9LAMI|nr:hypothetical protein BUALT_Bualt06G0133500 [Buddleja alternifolia]